MPTRLTRKWFVIGQKWPEPGEEPDFMYKGGPTEGFSSRAMYFATEREAVDWLTESEDPHEWAVYQVTLFTRKVTQ